MKMRSSLWLLLSSGIVACGTATPDRSDCAAWGDCIPPDASFSSDGGAGTEAGPGSPDGEAGSEEDATVAQDGEALGDGESPLDSSMCTTGELNCPGVGCVDTSTSMSNCGGCGIPCTAPEGGSATCASSACETTCPGTQTACSGACVDTTSDSNHCGTCANACTAPTGGSTSCVTSSCDPACPSNEHVCGSACLPNTDPPSATDSCVITEAYGVFVAPTGSDSAAGTRVAPFLTLAHAMTVAHTQGLRVYACADKGSYPAALTVTSAMDGVEVYGGLSCATAAAWTYTGANAKVAPTVPGTALTITGVTTGVSFTSFEFDAQPAPANTGESVVAVLVNASSNVTFASSAITAGNAATGAAGTTVANYSSSQATTGNSASGLLAGGTLTCTCTKPTGDQSEGGRGGFGDAVSPTPGAAGSSTPSVASPAANEGSPQEDGGICQGGGSGNTGANGNGGTRSSLALSLSASGLGVAGGTGNSGSYASVGQGGGGGGGGASATTGGGGSGGCGGCGGGYGTGGSPGGSSVGLAAVNSSVIVLSGCTIAAGSGGTGGAGGPGEAGQGGGFGGNGAPPGCNGGTGGSGGVGGGGAGGAGGSSYGIAYTGSVPSLTNGTMVSAGTAGGGGTAGSGGSAQAGASGTSSTTPTSL